MNSVLAAYALSSFELLSCAVKQVTVCVEASYTLAS